ncbi:MAG TPA: DNA ligase D [Gammaproteobacteria bacterium]|nr:DNA ligase D [Gammaproteobacteria bacterium]
MDNLTTYRQKRNFKRTSEPAGADGASRPGSDDPIYIIHKHDASRLHFDLRLEEDGVLRSWAVPKGPSLKVGERHLAVAVEDHPFEYKDFEGTIPEKEYGGGTVMLWDRGHWRAKKEKTGHIDFELNGDKLAGSWTLVQMQGKAGEGGKNWLLIKRRDRKQTRKPAPPGDDDVSVASGRTMEEIARGAKPKAHEEVAAERAAKLKGARKAALPREPSLRLATLGKQAPDGDDWLHEIKFDGYRLLARLDHGKVRLLTRNAKNWSERFPALGKALAKLQVDSALLDGELVSLDAAGVSRFGALQEAISERRTDALVYFVFDLLYLDGYDLKKVILRDRKRLLAELLGSDPPALIRYTDHVAGNGPAFFEKACESGLEGIVSKRVDSPYSGGRSKQWRKTKCVKDAEFIVGGYTDPAGSRTGFGALLLGAYDDDGKLAYAGRVGTGFSDRQLAALHKTLKELEIGKRPFREAVPDSAGVHWVRPTLVVDVTFTERTRDGRLRHPSFRGLREDRNGDEIRLHPRPAAKPAPKRSSKRRTTTRARGKGEAVAGVRLSNPNRVLYEQMGITKLDLAHYYESIADWILPQLADRPLSLLRCPSGAGNCFFQKHPGEALVPGMPRIDITENNGDLRTYVYVHALPDLISLVQAGTLEIHPWGSRVDNVDKPDLIVFDLDPSPEVGWAEVLRVAGTLRERLEQLGLTPFVRLTGGKGLHLVVPLRRRDGWDEIKAFARAVCEAHVHDEPKKLTATMSKAKRRGRIFLDYLRNGRGATAIASYSTRAHPHAPVSVPVRWDELSESIQSDYYRVDNLPQRLAALKANPWADFESARRQITKAMRKAVGMKT